MDKAARPCSVMQNQVTPSPKPRPRFRRAFQAPDPDDDMVLATAIAAQADVLISGDDDLLCLKSHQGIRILSPRRFLELLDGRRGL